MRWMVVTLGMVVDASAYFLIGASGKPGGLDAFAQCLREQRVRFYGAFWCPHCQQQKAMFGVSQRWLPYVECSTPDGRNQTAFCHNNGIQQYPTWEFPDGSRETRELSLSYLAEKRAVFCLAECEEGLPWKTLPWRCSPSPRNSVCVPYWSAWCAIGMDHSYAAASERGTALAWLIAVAGDHYYGQMVQSAALICHAGETISPCAQRFVLEFGYVTIPMMALTAFIGLIVLMLMYRRIGSPTERNRPQS
jgi:hypothetical protein